MVLAAVMAEMTKGFGPDYIDSKFFDPRLISVRSRLLWPAPPWSPVWHGGLHRRSTPREESGGSFHLSPGCQLRSGNVHVNAESPRRVVYAEGEEDRVLRGGADAGGG